MFSENLKKARKRAKLSQEKVAELISTSRSNISKYETGFLEPNLQKLRALCKLYNVSADYLLDLDLNKNVLINTTETSKNVNINQGNFNQNNINIK